jgi:hypothetical protein
VRRQSVSEAVALRLLLPGVVVTWFVTGFPDPGKADGSRAVPLGPALRRDNLTVAGRGESAQAGNMQAEVAGRRFSMSPTHLGRARPDS